MGEVRGRAPAQFDFGNSSFEVNVVDLTGKTIVQRTSAGTQGIVAAASRARRLYAASLVAADATVRAMLADKPKQISIVAMGGEGFPTRPARTFILPPSPRWLRDRVDAVVGWQGGWGWGWPGYHWPSGAGYYAPPVSPAVTTRSETGLSLPP